MEELQLALTTARVDQRNFGLWISNWQVGQVLNALVTGQLPSGDLVLRVGSQQITATSDIPIQQGAQLRLEVKQLEPGPTLRVLNQTPAPDLSAGGNRTQPEPGSTLRAPNQAPAPDLSAGGNRTQPEPGSTLRAPNQAPAPDLSAGGNRTQLEPGSTLRVPNQTAGSELPAGVNATLRLLPALRGDVATVSSGGLMQALQGVQAALPLPPALAASIDALLRLAARPERIGSASGLAQAVEDSGLFLEGRLAAGEEAPRESLRSDFKAGVLRALAQAQAAADGVEAGRLNGGDAQALSDLRRELEAGLGRITLNQLATQAGDSPVRAWQLEIPVFLAGVFDTLTLRIERESGRGPGGDTDGEDDASWRVRLDLAPPGLGAVHLDLRLSEARLALAIGAELSSTRRLLDGAMGRLEAALAARGIALEATPARRLAAAETADPARTTGGGVDLRA